MRVEYFLTEFKNEISGRVTHQIISKEPFVGVDCVPLQKKPRIDLMAPEDPLQAAILRLDNLATFIPHVHLNRNISAKFTRTVEAWIIIQGSVEAFLYDTSANLIKSVILNANDVVITIEGGHNYVSRQDGTIVLEVKSGPYDSENDKVRF